MRHARADYDRIQDPAGLIPDDEPVFLLRGQDIIAPRLVEQWADEAEAMGVAPEMVQAARNQAHRMLIWQERRVKHPDMPKDAGTLADAHSNPHHRRNSSMSAEERAHLLANDLLARGMVPILTHEARAVIAQAIREAQASARNEALEEAAVAAERVPLIPLPLGDIPERFAWRAAMQDECASAILKLKTKD